MEAHAKDVPENRTLPRVGVSGEMIAILAVGVMLAGLVFTTGSWIRDDMQILRDGLHGDVQILRDDLYGDIRILRDDMQILRDEVRTVQLGLSELRERLTRVEERGARVESGLGEVHERVIRIESLLGEDSSGLQG